jgi:hypothetical protein
VQELDQGLLHHLVKGHGVVAIAAPTITIMGRPQLRLERLAQAVEVHEPGVEALRLVAHLVN